MLLQTAQVSPYEGGASPLGNISEYQNSRVKEYGISLSPLQCNYLICRQNDAAFYLRESVIFSTDNQLFIGLYGAIDSAAIVFIFGLYITGIICCCNFFRVFYCFV